MAGILLIGEKLNSSRSSAKKIFEERDETALLGAAQAQIAGGATCIDLNASMLMDAEGDALRWGARILREKLRVQVMLDSPDPRLLMAVAPEFGGDALLNSFTCDEDMLRDALPVASRAGSSVVIMLKDRKGVPETVGGRISLAERAVASVSAAGLEPEDVFIDPLLTPVATSRTGMLLVLETIRELKERFPSCGRIGGLSNISFGLPERKLLNRTCAAMLVAAGMTALICDTTDRDLVSMLKASEVLAGLDPSCRNFLEFYRAGHRTG